MSSRLVLEIAFIIACTAYGAADSFEHAVWLLMFGSVFVMFLRASSVK